MKKNKLEELKENYKQIIEKNTKIKNNISTIRLILCCFCWPINSCLF